MTDNLPAVRSDVTRPSDPDSWIPVVQNYATLAERIAETEFVPKNLRGKAPAVAAAILYGREVGLPPMTALTMTHVVEGRPAISAEGMRALVLSAGHDLEVLEASGGLVRMRGRRRGSETWTSLEWSIDMARAAKLAHKDNWQHYPRAMLIARCTADLCRMIFPDVIHGFRALEELDETTETEQPQQVQSTTTVRRKTSRKPAAAIGAAAPATEQKPPAPAGVPLPGEPGYELPLVPGASDPEPEREAGDGSEAPPVAPPEAPAGTDEEAPPPEEEPKEAPAPAGPRKVSRAQLRMLQASIKGLGIDDRDERLRQVSRIVRREVDSTADLTVEEASAVIDTVARVKSAEDLEALLEATEETS